MLFCLVYLRWVFMKGVFAVGSEAVAVCDIIIFKNIAFCRNYLSCLFVMFCFGRVFDWEIVWVVCCGFFVIDFTFDWWDGLSCLFWRFVFWIVLSDCLIWLIVPIGCFLLNCCDFVWKKKNKGLTVHCNVAFVKPYVKMSARWFKRLILWFGRVLFVVKTLLYSERRFASNAS